ncbi:7-cyano-7-deazaguanine/7-aminomethyl-7-deazaguanine transporter [Halomonas sp. 18H]|uniref:7-cyano-7-deazaguanine/7-aminomethyl-7- deazaguanine transporter n=1 Tax=Halomonas almeriensis TaxID=308163 RepID=UPI002230F6E2|nr:MULTISPECIES: 7-cyano-7-deazaguanine/7-aminomethyl-7-deazaguanine transporter [Halomonas]MCW4151918.1 7-cyano-7-deazaguanine/7-aminomethyl-7-deazaguanine transporter [Halomonas sp. 18H]MDN3554153.1 7-cyano-7-deazaguanine/7-aminomethyl-7-deazaguanine transporter [Halomonas almeriensis]
MFILSSTQARRCLLLLVSLHILVIAASNYLVQLPFSLFGWHTTWGAFSFPFIFLTTDLTVRLFGKEQARAIVLRVMFPALVISYVVSVMFPKGGFAGLGALSEWNLFVGRIALASFMAYVVGQLLDITVFDRLRRLRAWWVAPAMSTLLGNFADTFAFFSIAFHHSPDPFMAANWPEIAWVDYVIKLGISLVFFLPLYGVLLSGLSRWLVGVTGRDDKLPEQAGVRP